MRSEFIPCALPSCVLHAACCRRGFHADAFSNHRLRQTDVKAGHYERKVQALEQSNAQWETKYEEMAKKYADTKKELDDFVAEIGTI